MSTLRSTAAVHMRSPFRLVVKPCWKRFTRGVPFRASPQKSDNHPKVGGLNGEKQPGEGRAAELPRGAAYYAGLVNSSLLRDNQASSTDMLVRNLQLAGGVAGLLGLLLLLFMASNGLLSLPDQA